MRNRLLIGLAVFTPVAVVALLIAPSEIYTAIFPYFPGPIQRGLGTAALRAACADADAGAMQSVAMGYLEFAGKAAEPGKLSKLVPDDVQLLCLRPERAEPMSAMMTTAIFMRGNDFEARRSVKSESYPEGFCRSGDTYSEDVKLRIISICRGLGLPQARPSNSDGR